MYYKVFTKSDEGNVIKAELIIRAESIQEAVNMTDSCGLFDIVSIAECNEEVKGYESLKLSRAFTTINAAASTHMQHSKIESLKNELLA